MKKGLTVVASLIIMGSMLTGCGSRPSHHKSTHTKTTVVKHTNHEHKPASSHDIRKSTKVDKKNIDKSGLSDSDIKKDSRAVQQKKSSQPVD